MSQKRKQNKAVNFAQADKPQAERITQDLAGQVQIVTDKGITAATDRSAAANLAVRQGKRATGHQPVLAVYAADRSLPQVTAADAALLTHMLIAFGVIVDGQVSISHLQHLDQLDRIRQANPALLLLLSVGGWGAGGFSEAAASAAGRRRFAASAVAVMRELQLDGLDLDWEYPCYAEAGITANPADRRHFTSLLQTLRLQMDEAGRQDHRHYSLSIAAGADQYYIDGTDMAAVQQSLDFIQLMTYDMRGGFQTLTGHHTNLYTPDGDLFRISVDASVQMFLGAGVPREKLVIGAAFYSRMWRQVPDQNHGLHQMTSGSGGYGPDYGLLTDQYIGKNGYTRHWDDVAKAPWLFDGQTFITYDDPESLRHKCAYLRKSRLAGIMAWEYGCDPTHELISTMAAQLGRK